MRYSVRRCLLVSSETGHATGLSSDPAMDNNHNQPSRTEQFEMRTASVGVGPTVATVSSTQASIVVQAPATLMASMRGPTSNTDQNTTAAMNASAMRQPSQRRKSSRSSNGGKRASTVSAMSGGCGGLGEMAQDQVDQADRQSSSASVSGNEKRRRTLTASFLRRKQIEYEGINST